MNMNNLTTFIDNQMSNERHKLNLVNIYQRKDDYAKDYTLDRLIRNKLLSKENVKKEDQYYVNRENEILKKKLNKIFYRENVSYN